MATIVPDHDLVSRTTCAEREDQPLKRGHLKPGSDNLLRRLRLLVCLGCMSSLCGLATGADFSISGFGTLGYARSDQPYHYQRFIDDGGTFRRDSVVGLQADVKLSDSFGATLQVVAAPASDDDGSYEGDVAWAFLSYRPNDDWLLRLGRQRIPFYLYSQSYDVGVTYDFVRLPTEMYSISPSNNFDGVSFSKSWGVGRGDVTLDGYWGQSKLRSRYWLRDGVPPTQIPGTVFNAVAFKGGILVLSYKKDDDTYRAGVIKGIGRFQDGSPIQVSYPFVPVAPGIGYYQVDDALPGPGVGTVSGIHNTIVTVGADVGFEAGVRMIAEFARTYVTQPDVDFANASSRGYVSLLKRIDKWTPYLTYGFLRSESAQIDLYDRVNNNSVPSFVPGASLINPSQRLGADGMLTYDQSSLAVGTSYSFSATSKVKAELMRTRIGRTSSLVDGPPGSNIRNQNINVLSVSYSFVF